MKNFTEELGINGHLTIIKRFTDGQEEVVFDDHNIIVSGMGVGLTYMFTGSGSNSVLDYQIDRFQIGVSGPPAGGVTSAIYELSGALDEIASYGAGSNLFLAKFMFCIFVVDIFHVCKKGVQKPNTNFLILIEV